MNHQLVVIARSVCIHVAFMPVVLLALKNICYVAQTLIL